MVSPPICRTPTSKLTRVRVEGFSKTSATIRPASGCSASGSPRGALPRAAFIAPACARIALQIRGRRGVHVEKMPHAAAPTAASTAVAAASSRRKPSSTSASVRFNGGSSRTTFSAAGTTSTRAS